MSFQEQGRRNYVKEEMERKIKEDTNKRQIQFGKRPLIFGPEYLFFLLSI